MYILQKFALLAVPQYLMQEEQNTIPTGSLGINYNSPEAGDWLLGNDNMPDSLTVRLSSFDSHIISS